MEQLGSMAGFQGHWLEEGPTLKKSPEEGGVAYLRSVGAGGGPPLLGRTAESGSGGGEGGGGGLALGSRGGGGGGLALTGGGGGSKSPSPSRRGAGGGEGWLLVGLCKRER